MLSIMTVKKVPILTASKVYEESSGEVFMVYEGRVNPRARIVIDAKVVHLSISAEKIALLLVNHQLLNKFSILLNIQMESGGRLAGP